MCPEWNSSARHCSTQRVMFVQTGPFRYFSQGVRHWLFFSAPPYKNNVLHCVTMQGSWCSAIFNQKVTRLLGSPQLSVFCKLRVAPSGVHYPGNQFELRRGSCSFSIHQAPGNLFKSFNAWSHQMAPNMHFQKKKKKKMHLHYTNFVSSGILSDG